MTSKKTKAVNYRKAAQDWDRIFQNLGLPRPQDENRLLLKRAQQINLGLVVCSENPKRESIVSYEPSNSVLTSKKSFKCYPTGTVTPTWIDDQEKFKKFMEGLSTCEEFAIDLEMHNHRTLTDYVCLIQIATWEYGDYLIDPFKVRDGITFELKKLLESKKYLKIGHDLTNDTKWLQKDFGIFMVGAVDTQVMWKQLHGETQISFEKLVKHYHPEIAINMPKSTLSDWRLRPGRGMTRDQEVYATNDVHVLLRIFDEMRQEMNESHGNSALVRSCEDTKPKLREIAKQLKSPSVIVDYAGAARDELRRMRGRKGIQFTKKLELVEKKGPKTFEMLFEWREILSKVIDDKPEMIVSSWNLLELAITDDLSIANIKKLIGSNDARICDPTADRNLQAGVVRNLLSSNGEYMNELREHECHNCLKSGHGPAWACPFPKNYRAFFLKPENEEYRHRQYNRRYNKLVEKVGEEKAIQIINKTKEKNNKSAV